MELAEVARRAAAGFGPGLIQGPECSRAFVTIVVAAGIVLVGAQGAGAGTVTGRVSVTQRGGRLLQPLQSVLVFVDGVRVRVDPTQVSIEMKGKKFLPHVVVVPVGSTVRFPNLDPIHHNAFSVSGPNRFDLELYRRPHSRAVSFDFPGVVRVFCNIHPQMSAIVLVRDNPYFAWAQPDGTFALTGVPPGRHTLKAWQEQAGEASIEVIVPPDGEVRVALALAASRYRPARHKNKYGRDYHPAAHY